MSVGVEIGRVDHRLDQPVRPDVLRGGQESDLREAADDLPGRPGGGVVDHHHGVRRPGLPSHRCQALREPRLAAVVGDHRQDPGGRTEERLPAIGQAGRDLQRALRGGGDPGRRPRDGEAGTLDRLPKGGCAEPRPDCGRAQGPEKPRRRDPAGGVLLRRAREDRQQPFQATEAVRRTRRVPLGLFWTPARCRSARRPGAGCRLSRPRPRKRSRSAPPPPPPPTRSPSGRSSR